MSPSPSTPAAAAVAFPRMQVALVMFSIDNSPSAALVLVPLPVSDSRGINLFPGNDFNEAAASTGFMKSGMLLPNCF